MSMCNIDKIKEHGNKIGLSDAQMESVMEYFDSDLVEDTDAFVGHFLATNKEMATNNFVIAWNLHKLTIRFRDAIENGRHQIMGVAGEYCYSVGLTNIVAHNPHELLVIGGRNGIAGLSINEVVDRWPNGDYPQEAFELRTPEITNDGSSMRTRARIIKVPNPNVAIEHLFPLISQWTDKDPENIYIIELADHSNKLPGEDGYDTNGYNQSMDDYISNMGK